MGKMFISHGLHNIKYTSQVIAIKDEIPRINFDCSVAQSLEA